jgi:hypothetical protein
VAAQATNGAVRYGITYEPSRDRWYIDASWALHAQAVATLEQLRYGPVVAVDLNVGHLAVSPLDRYGNPLGPPITVPLELTGLSATARDGHLRAAISDILAIAAKSRNGFHFARPMPAEEFSLLLRRGRPLPRKARV